MKYCQISKNLNIELENIFVIFTNNLKFNILKKSKTLIFYSKFSILNSQSKKC